MTTVAVRTPKTTDRRVTAGAACLVLSALVLIFFDFFVSTSSGKFASTGDYIYTLDGLPFLIGLAVFMAGLRSVTGGRDGALGRIGYIVTSIGVAAVVVCLLASMVTRSENSLGPLYVLGSFATFIGVILFSIGLLAGRVLPWWVGPALTVTWIVGGPVGDGGPLGFKGSALLLAAAVTAVSAAARKVP